jgi:hypothetical protein
MACTEASISMPPDASLSADASSPRLDGDAGPTLEPPDGGAVGRADAGPPTAPDGGLPMPGDGGRPDGGAADGGPRATVSLTVTFRADPTWPLVSWVDVEAPEPIDASLTARATGMPARSVGMTGSYLTRLSLPVVGFPEETALTLEVDAITPTGAVGRAVITPLTPRIPAELRPPEVAVIAGTAASRSGYVMVGVVAESVLYMAFDSAGRVVWMHFDRARPGFSTPLARVLDGGIVAVQFPGEIRGVDFTGRTRWSFEEPDGELFHHDYALLPWGNLLVLSEERRRVAIEGLGEQLVIGDVILELEPGGAEVARWSALDHLDTDRYPGPLSRARMDRPEGRALDWTHGNAIHFRESDNTVLFSARSQHRIYSIRWPSGDVQWTLGEGGDFALMDPGGWFSAQHAPMWTSSGRMLVYDNGNERGDGLPLYSRVVEYELDVASFQATQTFAWQTPHYTRFVGDVDELLGGRYLVTCGITPELGLGAVYEIDRAGATHWGVSVGGGNIYRADSFEAFVLDR